MPDLFGSIFAGAAQGYGAQVAAEGKATREAALRRIEVQDERAYQDKRDALAMKAADSRAGDLVYGADGKAYNRVGSTLTPIQSVDGTTVNLDPRGTKGEETFSTGPTQFTDAEGKVHFGTFGTKGTFKEIPIPAGLQPSDVLQKVETPTEVQFVDRRTGAIVTRTSKDNEQANADKARGTGNGKAQSAAQVALPGAISAATQVSSLVDSLMDDDYLENMLGFMDSNTPDWSANSKRVAAKIDQLGGEAFLQARQMLKGGGAITDFEGQMAQKALLRMNRGQSVSDFKAALKEFNEHIQKGVAILAQQAQAGEDPGSAQQQPDPGQYQQNQPSQPVSGKTKSGLSFSVEGP